MLIIGVTEDGWGVGELFEEEQEEEEEDGVMSRVGKKKSRPQKKKKKEKNIQSAPIPSKKKGSRLFFVGCLEYGCFENEKGCIEKTENLCRE